MFYREDLCLHLLLSDLVDFISIENLKWNEMIW